MIKNLLKLTAIALFMSTVNCAEYKELQHVVGVAEGSEKPLLERDSRVSFCQKFNKYITDKFYKLLKKYPSATSVAAATPVASQALAAYMTSRDIEDICDVNQILKCITITGSTLPVQSLALHTYSKIFGDNNIGNDSSLLKTLKNACLSNESTILLCTLINAWQWFAVSTFFICFYHNPDVLPSTSDVVIGALGLIIPFGFNLFFSRRNVGCIKTLFNAILAPLTIYTVFPYKIIKHTLNMKLICRHNEELDRNVEKCQGESFQQILTALIKSENIKVDKGIIKIIAEYLTDLSYKNYTFMPFEEFNALLS